MRKFLMSITMVVMVAILLSACGKASGSDESGDEKLKVVTSFTIIKDLAKEIGGDDVDVHNLVPTGTDPHEFNPLPEDTKKATDADVLFYNGLNLEGGKDGWFFKLIDSVDQKDEHVFSLTERVDPMYLGGEDGRDEEINPHAFIDPAVGIKMAEDMRDALIEVDPDREDDYNERAEAYLDRLEDVNQEYEDKLGEIPEEDRTLVTSERAFQYLADHFDLNEAFIWEIDTEENGSPEQIKELITFIQEHNAPVLFVESNVDTRPMETVSEETGVDIYEKPIYSDEIGEPGEEVDTYMKYLNYNLDVLYEGMKQ